MQRWPGALSPEDFEKILFFVGLENILSPQEWMSRLENGRLGEHDLCLTFDDGLRCQVEYALPVLEQHDLQAFWFVYSSVFKGIPVKGEIYSYVAGQVGGTRSVTEEFLDRCPPEMLAQLDSDEFTVYANLMREVAPFYSSNDMKYRFLRNRTANKKSFENLMDRILSQRGFDVEEVGRRLWLADSDLKALAKSGHYVGLHSYDHPYDMAQLTREEQHQQYEKNYAHIVAASHSEPRCMSHPLNSYNEDSLTVLGELGIKCGFRANVIPPLCGPVNPSALELAREDSANLFLMMKPSGS